MTKQDERKAFDLGADDLGVMDVLVYGDRLPDGLTYLLKARPEHVESLTVVCSGAMRAAWFDARLGGLMNDRQTIVRMDDLLDLPWFGRTFSFAYSTVPLAKTFDCRPHVTRILSSLRPNSVCYFDLRGVEIDDLFADRGFVRMATLGGLTGFYRRAEPVRLAA